ncbi:Septum site-determining protein MinD [hydrothermal vent metagenome]|uniref:Septum site-determining protein MinD n=1 Tax=hydrothermal vent metagenome TaxID=652676 RepID=A0A1W1BLC6_9ZZZZ
MGIVVAVISGKGGVGKTTAVANIGLGVAMNDKKCIVVDFDIGQRNLDMILGLENRVVYDMVQVMDGEASVKQAIIRSKVNQNLHFLAASQSKDKSVLSSEKVKKLVQELKESYDYVILDSPAGIESGFEHTIEFADAAIVVVNPEVSSIRDADRAIGILDSKSQKVKDGEDVAKYLIINRIVADMVQSGEMLRSEDILDILSIKLVGKVPEDSGVIDASNQGKPVILNKNSIAGQAYTRISARLCGKKVEMKNVEISDSSLFKRIKGMFR